MGRVAFCPDNNMEAVIITNFPSRIPLNVGRMSDPCASCGALHWKGEQIQKDKKAVSAKYSSCCGRGTVIMPRQYDDTDYPMFLNLLLTGIDDCEFSLNTSLIALLTTAD
jgi:hypothetical protein